jgi:NAD-dependent dihydropyrimidine dehydrogenase PreA subunit
MSSTTTDTNLAGKSGIKAIVDKRRCGGCRVCVEICPNHAISMDKTVVIDSDQCNGCGSCVAECPNEAISLSEV